jgi:ABC-2 type transport system permease protein
MKNINAITAIAFRDITKLFRDKTRILANFVFPVVFIGVLGGSLQSNLQESLPYNFLTFVFTGVIAQTLFQSTASGIISLVEDRQNDFAQELFVSPIPRYSILIGKILGETIVSFIQVSAVILFGILIGVPLVFPALIKLFPFFPIIAFMGGAFGVLVMSTLTNQKTASQIFPFLIFPQFFLAGVFNPIKILPAPILLASRAMPMTYAVDLVRSIYYAGSPERSFVVLFNTRTDLIVVLVLFVIFLTLGTYLFVKNEKDR